MNFPVVIYSIPITKMLLFIIQDMPVLCMLCPVSDSSLFIKSMKTHLFLCTNAPNMSKCQLSLVSHKSSPIRCNIHKSVGATGHIKVGKFI